MVIPVMLLFFFYMSRSATAASKKQSRVTYLGQDTVPQKDTAKFGMQEPMPVRYEATDTVPKKDSISKLDLLTVN